MKENQERNSLGHMLLIFTEWIKILTISHSFSDCQFFFQRLANLMLYQDADLSQDFIPCFNSNYEVHEVKLKRSIFTWLTLIRRKILFMLNLEKVHATKPQHVFKKYTWPCKISQYWRASKKRSALCQITKKSYCQCIHWRPLMRTCVMYLPNSVKQKSLLYNGVLRPDGGQFIQSQLPAWIGQFLGLEKWNQLLPLQTFFRFRLT